MPTWKSVDEAVPEGASLLGTNCPIPMAYQYALAELTQQPRRSRITGAADFIGPNLLEVLLHHGRHVTGLDNFMTGCRENLEQVLTPVSAAAWANVHFIAGDIRCVATCNEADCARR